MLYDPRRCGAKCDECPLGPRGKFREGLWNPVQTEDHLADGATVAIVGDSPDKDDAEVGRPFSGSMGGTLMRGLASARISRREVTLTNVIACRLPGKSSGAYRMLMDKIKKENKRRAAKNQPQIPHPADCCRPRLMHDLRNYRNVVTLGKLATNTLTGVTRGVDKVRGSPWGVTQTWQRTAYDSGDSYRLLLPTFHPRYIQRAPNRFHVWVRDMRKAWRLFTDSLEWEDPVIVNKPSPREILEWFEGVQPTRRIDGTIGPRIVCDDVETSRHSQGMRATQVQLRTVAFARWKDGIEGGTVECIGIPLLSVDGSTRFYSTEDERKVRDLLRYYLKHPQIVKMGHNAGQFDRLVYESHLNVTPFPRWDSIFTTRAANPSLPKGLKPNGRTYTDVGEWDSDEKESSIATGTQDDGELLRYNCFDTAVNLRLWAKLRPEAAAVGYFTPIDENLLKLGWWDGPMNDGMDAGRVPSLFDIDHSAQDRGVQMHRMGMWVNQLEVERQIKEAEATLARIWAMLQESLREAGVLMTAEEVAAGDDNDRDEVLNPGSTAKLKELYFETWDLPFLPATGGKDSQGRPIYNKRDFLTGTNDLSTSDTVHRHYLAAKRGFDADGKPIPLLDPLQFKIMYLVRIYRRVRNKILSTSLRPLRPEQPIYYGERSKKKGQIKGYTKSWLYPDGCVHSNFAAHITNVARYSSSGLNVQNIGNKKGQGALKKVFQAPPGWYFVGADINQAHIFIIANCWKIPFVQETIRNGWDPHNANAASVFGDAFTKGVGFIDMKTKPSSGTPARAMREIIKVFIYASVYGASPETIWSVLTSTEYDPPEGWLDGVQFGHLINQKTGETTPFSTQELVRQTMPYLLKSVDSIRAIHHSWLKNQPEWKQVWAALETEYKLKGHVSSYLFNRSSGDLGDDPNKIRNYPVLATESELMRMIEGRVERAFPRINGEGIFYQCHDSIGVLRRLPPGVDPLWEPSKEAYELWEKKRDPSGYPLQIARDLVTMEECFHLKIPGWEFDIRGEADAGRTLKDI